MISNVPHVGFHGVAAFKAMDRAVDVVWDAVQDDGVSVGEFS
ncbi:hypothetical protein Pr1d_33840 [Bythopirellula goksoeyrii]|uniref:Uncharacterized protein n=1 Tax=Bythopirellula goksoeyrii TaxID=1400387 RepID=A0A5B9QEP8_9BACT|nr:hypothetical protein Pr1d_33840 [Bythopirellula goksoeyrii]